MVKNYFKIFLRNLIKHPGYSISNIAGLAIGMITCILILLFVHYEFNWNTFNKNYENIYRVQQKVYFKGNTDIYAQTGYALAGELKSQISEIDKAIIVHEIWGEYLSVSDDLSFYEKKGYYVHSDVFDVFTFHFLKGNPVNALSEPFSVVLTKELADKYFPGGNAFGKMIKASQNKYLRVTGIIADLPLNLDFRPDYLVSFGTLKEVTGWKEYDQVKFIDAAVFRTYVMLKPNTSVKNVNEKIYNFFDKYVPDNFKKLYLKPLSEIHLTSNEHNDIKVALYYLGGIAIFVLILAGINFINLSTANSNLRKKEIGIRKVAGASRLSLFRQFTGEFILCSFLAMILAFILAKLLLPYFNTVVQRQLSFSISGDFNFILFMIAAFLVTGFLAGVYPSLFLTSFQPVDVIKGNLSFFNREKKAGMKSFFRKSLVTFQFFISITLIVSTIYVVKQVSFMKNKDLGFNKNNLLLCKVFGTKSAGNFETLRNELYRNPDIEEAAVSINAPFNSYWGKEINWEGAGANQKIGIGYNSVGYDFVNTYQIELVLGRNFSREFSTDSGSCLINETAMRQLSWKDPLGKRIDNNRYKIIGVVKDFHLYSVHVKIPSYYMTLNSGNLKDDGLYSIRIKPGSRNRVINFINQQFHQFFPGAIIEVANFDKDLQYGTEDVWEIVEKVFFAFSIIAILIAANGLFGLVSFAAQRRIKDIGIRKVFGANSAGLYLLMSKEFLFNLLAAVMFALPIGYLISVTTPGAYKYHLQFWDYFLSVGLMFMTALVATLYHTTKAVLANPVESLRYE